MPAQSFVMAMDVGGTFLDTVVVDEDGAITTTKVLSTHDDYAKCVRQAVESVSAKLGLSDEQFLKACRMVINGTTVATNVLAELKGPPVGLLATAGTGDTLYMARIHRWGTLDVTQLRPLPQIVPRERILEINERVDARGDVIVPLARDEIEQAVRTLVEKHHVAAIAICFLWSFQNPAHEQAAREVVNALYPDLPVSISSEVFPAIREYERTNTTVIDAFIAPGVHKYVDELLGYFASKGFDGTLRMVHAAGGVATPPEVKRAPVTLINSGPVAGYVGAMKFGGLTGRRNIITADVGGTSFDAGLIHDGKVSLRHRTMVPAPDHPSPGYLTGLSLMDVIAIGTGGGSIGWIDPRGMVAVGPFSAGSLPGPVCFGRGGTEPTLTDACLILGLLGADAFLGGSFVLDREAAVAAMRNRLVGHAGLTDEYAASAAVYRLACVEMANNVRRVSIEKGFDPRDFSLFSYGGAGGLFLAQVSTLASVPEMVAPENSAVFSAFGALMSDYRRSALRACSWRQGNDPSVLIDGLKALEAGLLAEIGQAGIALDGLVIERQAEMRFVGQATELTTTLPAGPLGDDFEAQMLSSYKATYAQAFGSESVWLNALAEVVTIRVTAVIPGASYRPRPAEAVEARYEPEPTGQREVFWPFDNQRRGWPVYAREALRPGAALNGPALIESANTTVVVPPGALVAVDGFRNLVLDVRQVS